MRFDKMRAWFVLGGILLMSALPARVPAQAGTPLPVDMYASFQRDQHWADSFRFESTSGDVLVCRLSFDTEDKSVSLDWNLKVGLITGVSSRVESVSFQPTAVCAEAGVGDAIYVAGYFQRTGATVIEKWALVNVATAVASNPAGHVVVELAYGIRKTLIYSTTYMLPIKSLFVHPTDETVYALEGTSAGKLWSVDPTTGVESLELDNSVYPHLTSFCHARTYFSATDGFLVMLDRTPVWRILEPAAWGAVLTLTDPGPEAMLLRDADHDGSFDDVRPSYSWSQFETDGYWDGIDPLYSIH